MENYDNFCKEKGCDEYVEWEFTVEGQYPCVSCKKVGQSHNIDSYPNDCPYLDEIQKIELEA